MAPYAWLFSTWGLVTVALIALLVYRSRLTRTEADWIPLTDDAREDRAIQAQTFVEMKTRKLRNFLSDALSVSSAASRSRLAARVRSSLYSSLHRRDPSVPDFRLGLQDDRQPYWDGTGS